MTQANAAAELYLDLLKHVLVRWDEEKIVRLRQRGVVRRLIGRAFAARGMEICQIKPFDAEAREFGRDWPDGATIIGMRRLGNIQYCVKTVIDDGVPGDLIEAGVWRGGACVFMRAALAAFGDGERLVWCADSFRGWPAPDVAAYPRDAGFLAHLQSHRAPTLETVKNNFHKYRLLDDRVKFLAGWFADVLPGAPIGAIAVLRVDADMYGSTMHVLDALYPKLSPGGFLLVNDYGALDGRARSAVDDYRASHGIAEPIVDIDGLGAFWRRVR